MRLALLVFSPPPSPREFAPFPEFGTMFRLHDLAPAAKKLLSW